MSEANLISAAWMLSRSTALSYKQALEQLSRVAVQFDAHQEKPMGEARSVAWQNYADSLGISQHSEPERGVFEDAWDLAEAQVAARALEAAADEIVASGWVIAEEARMASQWLHARATQMRAAGA